MKFENFRLKEIGQQTQYKNEKTDRDLEEMIKMQNHILESDDSLLMSKSDFNKYFLTGESMVNNDLKQRNVGDCYLISAINALRYSQYFEIMCRSSMKKNHDGSWQVKIPLLSKDSEIININPEEISSYWNDNFLKRRGQYNTSLDLRMKLSPVKGPEGFRVLEAAFIKKKFGRVNRFIAEGGFSREVFLTFCGENFKEDKNLSYQHNIKSGRIVESNLSSLQDKSKFYLDNFLKNFNSKIYVATASTSHNEVIDNKSLSPYHSYAIVSTDSINETIDLIDPINTSRLIRLTFEQFKADFFTLEIFKINCPVFLKNMNELEK